MKRNAAEVDIDSSGEEPLPNSRDRRCLDGAGRPVEVLVVTEVNARRSVASGYRVKRMDGAE